MKLAGISCVKFYGGRGLPYQEFDLFLTWKRVWNPGSRYLSPVFPLHASLNLVWTSSWKLSSRNFCGLTKWSSSWCCCLMQAWGLGLALMRMSLGPPAAPGSASCLRPACVSACPLQPDQTQTEPMHHDVAALFQFPAPGVRKVTRKRFTWGVYSLTFIGDMTPDIFPTGGVDDNTKKHMNNSLLLVIWLFSC